MFRFVAATLILALAGCASFRPLPAPPSPESAPELSTLSVIGPKGRLDRQARERLTERLKRFGDDNLLERHLATMQAVSTAPLITGNRVKLLVDGPSAYAAMFAAITAAKQHVNIEMYIFDEAHQGDRALTDVLVERASHGVAVNVMYDALGSGDTKPEVFDKLRAAGVNLCAFNPLNPADNRTGEFTQRDHRKIVVVDGQTAFTGGINFSAAYTSSSLRRSQIVNAKEDGWRDTQIQVQGPAAIEMQKLYLQTWLKQKCPDMKALNYLPAPVEAGNTLLRIDASSVDTRRNETYLAAISAVTFAVKSIDLTMAYFSPDSQLEHALRDAARRGVKVRLLLPGLSDFGGIVAAGRAHYNRLMKWGIEIYEERRALLHAKTLEIDDIWSTVGSANWDWLSFARNDEINIVVIDQGFAGEMRALFNDDLTRATPITKDEWKKRPLKQKLRERFWVIWERFL
ncbi:MAG TPA: phospholipase D-like domain-containing protein [Steroidobacteraceae bacterium]|nr:phospholipase D-like domain-containing protein [Steroidobacteraceae bacterium]